MRIAISGAGIAGPTLAFWLLRNGHEITLIEKAPHFRAGGYVIDFWGVGYTIAERMGILPQVHEAGYSIREVRFLDRHGNRASGFEADVFRRMTEGRFTSLPRGDLASIIYRAIEGRIESLFGNTITGIEECADDVLVTLEHETPRSFDLVVGADGQHSGVRRLVFGPESAYEKPLGYHVAAFRIEGYRPRDESIYISHAQPGRQVARVSLRNDQTMFLFVFANEHMPPKPEPGDLAERKAILHRVFDDTGWECPQILQAMDRVDEIYFDRVSQIVMPAWSKGRVVLVGDAAACASLLAGEGSSLAMAEAYVLAGELQRAGNDHCEAFRQYEQRLRLFIEGKQKSARKFAGSFIPKTRLGVWFRNQVMKLLAIRPIANFFIGDLRDDFDLPSE
ncbi:MAG TPA: FAD-binding domain [Gemmataceae bacterium]|nr:FAD-binding domain [Gemmataceae bacterium]